MASWIKFSEKMATQNVSAEIGHSNQWLCRQFRARNFVPTMPLLTWTINCNKFCQFSYFITLRKWVGMMICGLLFTWCWSLPLVNFLGGRPKIRYSTFVLKLLKDVKYNNPQHGDALWQAVTAKSNPVL